MAESIDTILNKPAPFTRGVVRTMDTSEQQPHMTFRNTGGGGVIKLPMPLSIISNVGIQWEQSELGMLGQGENLMNKFLEATSELSQMEAGAALTSIGKGLSNTGKSALLAAGLSSDSAFRDLVQNRTKVMLHPNAEMTFRGVGFRSFDFAFDLVPTNENMQDAITEAIKTFQEYSLPTITDADFKYFNYPNVWKIRFRPSEEYLPTLIDSYVTNVSVDYSGGGKLGWHEGTAPIHIVLNISVVESQIFTSEHASNGYYG